MKKVKLSMVCTLLIFISVQCTFKSQTNIIKNGIELKLNKLNLRIQFYAADVVRVEKWLPGTEPDTLSLVVIQKNLPEIKNNITENDSVVVLNSEKLKLLISKTDGHIEYLSSDSTSILKESGKVEIVQANLKNETVYSVKQNFSLTPEEAIYGFGQNQNGYLNYRGKTVKLIQTNTNAVTPFFISTNNYGIYWDNYSKTIFADSANVTSMWSDVAGNINYYFIAGSNMDGVIAGYRNLTGQAPMYGKWAYGYWQSKEHYENRAELLSIAREYRKRQIPIDNIIQDWDTWEGAENWNQIFFDPKKFPEPKEMIDSLHQQNFHVIVSVWCSFGPNTEVYKEMDKNGFLYPTVGWAKFKYFDVYNPAATSLFWKYINKGFF